MSSAPTAIGGMPYPVARRLLLAGGLLVLLVTAGVMYARRVDTVEVVAVLLFIPVFLAFTYWRIVGGLVGGVLASLVYLFLRLDAIDQVGLNVFRGHLLSRTIAYLSFGLLGGWAASQVEDSLSKLDLYDQIDDATGLFNARFLVQDIDLERARSTRYQTLFSLVLVDVPGTAFGAMSRRQRAAALKGLGKILRESVRTVDRVVHSFDGTRHRLAVVLPETGREGAAIFATRLVDWVTDYLRQRNAATDGVSHDAHTFPDEEAAITSVREEFFAVEQAEHPETAGEAPA
ncbi:MAG: Diguanylate cyclase, domain [Actinomycetota bacterium]|jgi:GGDEF domain-containing protein